MERIDPIVRWPGGLGRIEPAPRPDRVRARERGDGHGNDQPRRQPPEEDTAQPQDGEHVDVSA
jgi:hypothetical protein